MINPFTRAEELYNEYVQNSVTCDMKPSWEQLTQEEKAVWANKALDEHYGD